MLRSFYTFVAILLFGQGQLSGQSCVPTSDEADFVIIWTVSGDDTAQWPHEHLPHWTMARTRHLEVTWQGFAYIDIETPGQTVLCYSSSGTVYDRNYDVTTYLGCSPNPETYNVAEYTRILGDISSEVEQHLEIHVVEKPEGTVILDPFACGSGEFPHIYGLCASSLPAEATVLTDVTGATCNGTYVSDPTTNTFQSNFGFPVTGPGNLEQDTDGRTYSKHLEVCISNGADSGEQARNCQTWDVKVYDLRMATMWFVDGEYGSDVNNSGTSWNDAFRTIHRAIDEAEDYHQIWVKAGTYPFSAPIDVNHRVAIYGGFAGMETEREQRDWKNNLTIVDGQELTNCFSTFEDTTIDGLTITRCGSAALAPYGHGGGIANLYSSLIIRNCTLSDNYGWYGGAIDSSSDSFSVISNCTFAGNHAEEGGGAVSVGATAWGDSTVNIDKSRFYGNSANGESGGGAIHAYSSAALNIANSMFSGNTGSVGGAISLYATPTTISNSVFFENEADGGGALRIHNSDTTIINSTIFGNIAIGGSGAGGISHSSWDTVATVSNSIVWGNTAPQIYSTDSIDVSFSDVQGGYPGTGNINHDPHFLQPLNGDFHLLSFSPCIDAGNNDVEEISLYDIDGDARKYDGDGTGDAVVDMGADEYTGDVDRDSVSDEEEWGEDGQTQDHDGNNDGTPDSRQDNVASLHSFDGSEYVTLEATGGATFANVQAVVTPPGIPPEADIPYGFYQYDIENLPADGTALVKFYLPAPVNSYYKYGPTLTNSADHSYEFAFDGTTGAEWSADTLNLHFVDGLRGDGDLTANLRIVEPGGPATTNQPPVADAGSDQTLECAGTAGTTVVLDGTASTDPDGDTLTYEWTDEANAIHGTASVVELNLVAGTQTFTLTVDDGNGGTDDDEVEITVADTTAPEISNLGAIPSSLWPPNRKMVPVAVDVAMSDTCDSEASCHIVSVVGNEQIDGDWELTGELTLNLRSEREGGGHGRIYEVSVECIDSSGNVTNGMTKVTVPHDQGKKKKK